MATSGTFDYKAFNKFRKTPKYWGLFDASKNSHKYILSLVRQLGWEKQDGARSFADMERLGEWLQSDKSPVNKPLKKMTPDETSRIIVALEQMGIKKYKQ